VTGDRGPGAMVAGAAADSVGRLLAAGSWLRRARVFHPYGVVCTAELVPAPVAGRLRAVHTVLFGAGARAAGAAPEPTGVTG
jgi:hypothetical protein